MSFKMTCPKCGTHDYSIEKDNRMGFHNDDAALLVFSCRCGKQIFGVQVIEEYKRQKSEAMAEEERVRAEQAQRDDEESRREEVARERLRTYLRAKGEAERSGGEVEAEVVPEEPVVEAVPEDEICGWDPCQNRRRPNSKYCSRACSNRNARARYKERQRDEHEDPDGDGREAA